MPFKDTYLECMLAIVRDVVVKKKKKTLSVGVAMEATGFASYK